MNIIEKLGVKNAPWKGEKECIIDSKDQCIMTCTEGEVTRGDRLEDIQTALLVSQAPEMLEALIDNVLMIEAIPHYLELDSWEYNNRVQSIDIIENATGKTWEEIKELKDEH